jgi:hypothetical protein
MLKDEEVALVTVERWKSSTGNCWKMKKVALVTAGSESKK